MISKREKKTDPKPVRCAVYTRKSTEHGLEQEYSSLDAQRDSGISFIRSRETLGWTYIPIHYDDGGFSGGTMDRPALNRLFADIKAGLIDCVVVYKVDRLSRSLSDFTKMVEMFDEAGVSFVSVTQNFSTTDSMGKLTLNILLSFAQFERELISERTRDKIAASRRRGKFGGGRPVLGYDLVDSKLTINEMEAQQVREIFELYLDKKSLLSVAKSLNQRAWTTKRWVTKDNKVRGGNEFTKNNVSYLLRNPVYIGKIPYHDQIFDGEHEGIVDPEVFEMAQSILRDQAKLGKRGPRSNHGGVLVGLLRCKSCSCAMTHTYTARGRKRYRYYVCNKAQKKGYASCPAPSVSAAQIEKFILGRICSIGDDPVVLERMLAEVNEQTNHQQEALDREEKLIGKQLTSAYNELSQVSLLPHMEDRMATIQEQINSYQKRIADVRKRLEQCDSEQIDPEQVKRQLQEFETMWAVLPICDQAELLSLMIKSVELDGPSGKLDINYQPHGIQNLLNQEVAV